jgi:hypothetical protein
MKQFSDIVSLVHQQHVERWYFFTNSKIYSLSNRYGFTAANFVMRPLQKITFIFY